MHDGKPIFPIPLCLLCFLTKIVRGGGGAGGGDPFRYLLAFQDPTDFYSPPMNLLLRGSQYARRLGPHADPQGGGACVSRAGARPRVRLGQDGAHPRFPEPGSPLMHTQ